MVEREAKSIGGGPIWPKFELVQDIVHLKVTDDRRRMSKYNVSSRL